MGRSRSASTVRVQAAFFRSTAPRTLRQSAAAFEEVGTASTSMSLTVGGPAATLCCCPCFDTSHGTSHFGFRCQRDAFVLSPVSQPEA